MLFEFISFRYTAYCAQIAIARQTIHRAFYCIDINRIKCVRCTHTHTYASLLYDACDVNVIY